MSILHSKKLAAGFALAALLALPLHAAPRDRDTRDSAISRIVKLVKRVVSVVTTGDYPTIPKP